MNHVEKLHHLRRLHRAGISDCQKEYVMQRVEELQREDALQHRCAMNIQSMNSAMGDLIRMAADGGVYRDTVTREASDLWSIKHQLDLLLSVVDIEKAKLHLRAAE